MRGWSAWRLIAPMDGRLVAELREPGRRTLEMRHGLLLPPGAVQEVGEVDDESFTFMTPEGHTLSAWITFSARREGDVTIAQAQALE